MVILRRSFQLMIDESSSKPITNNKNEMANSPSGELVVNPCGNKLSANGPTSKPANKKLTTDDCLKILDVYNNAMEMTIMDTEDKMGSIRIISTNFSNA